MVNEKEFVSVIGAKITLPKAELQYCLSMPSPLPGVKTFTPTDIVAAVDQRQVHQYGAKKVVLVDGKPEAIVSNRYRLIQHEDAFSPILKGLVEFAPDAQVRTGSNGPHAYMDALIDGEVTDTVKIGFRVSNSHDGAHAIKYSFEAQKVHRYKERVERKAEVGANEKLHQGGYRYIEVVGFRQVCSNGMKVRIPVAEAQRGIDSGKDSEKYSIRSILTEIWQEDQAREDIEQLIRAHSRVLHMGKPEEAIQQQKETVRVILALTNPVKRMIERAQNEKVNVLDSQKLLIAMFGKAHGHAIVNSSGNLKTAWDVYNATTYYSSHRNLKHEVVERIENRAADYLVHMGRLKLAPLYLRKEGKN